MGAGTTPKSQSHQRALWALLRTIAVRDRPKTPQALRKSPLLARLPLEVGATRQRARACFFTEISHYVYAGDTPLHVAAAAYQRGVAPLHRAVRTRCTAAVRALLMNGADARRRNGNGSTPLHLAVQSTGRGGSGSAAAREQQATIVRLLLDHGARASDTDSAGKSVRDCVKTGWMHALLSHGQ